MNGPVALALVWFGGTDPALPPQYKARFTWTGERWHFNWWQVYDKKGVFKRIEPRVNFKYALIHELEAAALEVFGLPYSEKWQRYMMSSGAVIIALE